MNRFKYLLDGGKFDNVGILDVWTVGSIDDDDDDDDDAVNYDVIQYSWPRDEGYS